MVRSFKSRDGAYAVFDCSSWTDFKVSLREVLSANGAGKSISDRFIFRGQSCSSWGLMSSFDRENIRLSAAARDNKYKELIETFKESYKAYGGISNFGANQYIEGFDDFDDIGVEAVAQHYGLGTRLLDWSYSPYVSAFFAISNTTLCTSGRASIWALDRKAFEALSKSELQYFRDLRRSNVRNLWQMGAFVRNYTANPDISDFLKSSSKSYDHDLDKGPPLLIRFDIPISDEQEILDDLQLMRINAMTIFPGMEGVVSWLRRKFV